MTLPLIEPEAEQDAATELIRKKVAASYAREPNSNEEALDVTELGSNIKRSKHQQYMYDLTTSGKSVVEIQTAWHEYYAGLTDEQKHQVWKEFYSAHGKSAKFITGGPKDHPPVESSEFANTYEPTQISTTVSELRDNLMGNVSGKKKLKKAQHMQSLAFGLAVGTFVILIFMFSFFNERFIAPFIQPSRASATTQIISNSGTVGPESKVIIPKINVEIPVIYGVNSTSEDEIQKALEGGVVHYTNTALPGTNGNVAIVGHSSNNIFNKGKYKFAFVLLSRLEVGDTFYLQKDGKRYTYQIYDKKIVKPTEVGVLGPADKPAVATLITCDPPGTSTNRLVVVGEQISPDPSTNAPGTPTQSTSAQPQAISGNSPSLWSRIWDSL